MILLFNTAATFFLCGVIWYVQLAHYPLFSKASGDGFPEFHRKHVSRTTWVVVAPMLVELLSSAALCAYPQGLTPREAYVGLGLVLAIWISTYRLQVPQHRQLEAAFDHAVVDALVQGNWIRTALWTARAALCAAGVSRLLHVGAT